MGGKLVLILALGLVLTGGWYWLKGGGFYSPKGREKQIEAANLAKYDFNELKARGGKASKIVILGKIPEIEDRRKKCIDPKFCLKSKDLNFETREISFVSEGKKLSGMINMPMGAESRKRSAIIMIRGYADKPGYYSGSGSWRIADQLAHAGYVTVSLDFLGFAASDPESTDMMEARFEKVPAVLDLIESVKALEFVDANKVGIWAHSNGGQIALSVLEVTGGKYPTALWAPMTNPFPQSVLDTASDLDDGGRAVIAAISDFQKKYDPRRYAFENYYEWIKSPVLIQQGTADVWCQVEWQEAVVSGIQKSGSRAKLTVYPGNDHNLQKDWDKAVAEDLGFFSEYLK